MNNLGLVVFVQRDDTQEILQAATFLKRMAFSLASPVTVESVKPNETASFSATLTNTGTLDDSYNLTLTQSLPAGWNVLFCNGTCPSYPMGRTAASPHSIITFMPVGASQNLAIDVFTSNTSGNGIVTLTVTSQSDPTQTYSIVFDTIAAGTPTWPLLTLSLFLSAIGFALLSLFSSFFVFRSGSKRGRRIGLVASPTSIAISIAVIAQHPQFALPGSAESGQAVEFLSLLYLAPILISALALTFLMRSRENTLAPERFPPAVSSSAEQQAEQEEEIGSMSGVKTAFPGRIATGYKDLDNLLLGGIPVNYAVIMTSPSCDERDLLVKKFLEAGAKQGQITFYVTIEARAAKNLAEEFQSNFYLFICNPQADTVIESLPNVFKLRGVESLTDINIALTAAFRKLDMTLRTPRRACIEIISDVLLQHHALSIRRWLSALVPELKSRDFTTLAVINPAMHHSDEVQAILDLFDGEISLHEENTAKGLQRFLRVKKMYNQRYLETELHVRRERICSKSKWATQNQSVGARKHAR